MTPTNNGLVRHLQPGRSEHVARDDCSCRPCRHARRRAAEVGLSPLEKLELVPSWKRVLVAIAAVAFVTGVCILIGSALLAVLLG